MFKTPQGPLKDWAGQKIGTILCRGCKREKDVKVNKAGWPYVICPHTPGCGYQEKAQSVTSANVIIKDRSYRWYGGSKKPVLAAISSHGKVQEDV